MAAAALLTAGFVSLEIIGVRDGAGAVGAVDWLGVSGVVLAFVLAIAINFAPGVISSAPRGSHFQENLQRNGRDQQRV
jgi:uncharacterized membrane protein